MDFWNHKVGVSKEAAAQQIAIITQFPPEKRLKIALDFANMGVNRTRAWIRESNPSMSTLEVNLEFVKRMYYQTGSMPEETWQFFKSTMEKKIKRDWIARFRKMMKEKGWTYDDVAQMGNFKNGKVVEATISRGLPAFAKLVVKVHEMHQSDT